MKLFILIGCCFLLSRCKGKVIRGKPYSFVVAGHVYGEPGNSNQGLFQPFVHQLNKLGTNFNFGVLTGDIVQNGNKEEWRAVKGDVDSIGINFHYAFGNHDYKNSKYIEENYKQTYYSFEKENDLHIILDPNLDGWDISGEQLLFLQNLINCRSNEVGNIFVYFHQLIWWSPTNLYHSIRLNSLEGRKENNNFWTEVEPIFNGLNNSVYFIAGDIGAAEWADDYSYHSYDNIHLISSGMGEGIGDNFLSIHVNEKKKVSIVLYYLFNGESVKLNE